MAKRDVSHALTDWREAPAPVTRLNGAPRPSRGYRVEVGQRFHRVGLPTIVWRAIRAYRDGQGLEHVVLASNRPDLDPKTLSAAILLDRRHYRQI